MWGTSSGSLTGPGSPPGPAPHPWMPHRGSRTDTGCRGRGIGGCHVLNVAAIVLIRHDTEGRLKYPTRSTHIRSSTPGISHFSGPAGPTPRPKFDEVKNLRSEHADKRGAPDPVASAHQMAAGCPHPDRAGSEAPRPRTMQVPASWRWPCPGRWCGTAAGPRRRRRAVRSTNRTRGSPYSHRHLSCSHIPFPPEATSACVARRPS